MGSFTYTSMMIRAQARFRANAGEAAAAPLAAQAAPASIAPSPAAPHVSHLLPVTARDTIASRPVRQAWAAVL